MARWSYRKRVFDGFVDQEVVELSLIVNCHLCFLLRGRKLDRALQEVLLEESSLSLVVDVPLQTGAIDHGDVAVCVFQSDSSRTLARHRIRLRLFRHSAESKW